MRAFFGHGVLNSDLSERIRQAVLGGVGHPDPSTC
jgi:hypothetical protein